MPEPQTAPVRNKRLTRRRPPKRTTRALLYGSAIGVGANLAVSVLDLSETGIRLVIKSEMKVGQQVQVELESSSRRLVKVQATLIWILPTIDGNFCAGFQFDKTIEWGSILSLTAT
jgi:hypothetical protein